MMDLSIPYYEDNTRISNSAIGWFLKNGPLYLHKKLTGLIPDEKGPQLERGTMIHEFILQPEEFEKDYFKIGDRYGRVLFMREYASYIKDSMISPFLATYSSLIGERETS